MAPISNLVRTFLAIIAALFAFSILPTMALASGKITLKPSYDLERDQTKWSLGLPIYERIMPNLAWQSWLGYGFTQDLPDREWVKADEGLEAYYGPLAVGLGVTWQYSPVTEHEQRTIYSTMSLTLW